MYSSTAATSCGKQPHPLDTPAACCSTGEVRLAGSMSSVRAGTSGITNIWLNGVSKAVDLDLSGICSTYITATDPGVQISGRCVLLRMLCPTARAALGCAWGR